MEPNVPAAEISAEEKARQVDAVWSRLTDIIEELKVKHGISSVVAMDRGDGAVTLEVAIGPGAGYLLRFVTAFMELRGDLDKMLAQIVVRGDGGWPELKNSVALGVLRSAWHGEKPTQLQ